MTRHSRLAIAPLGIAVLLIVVGEVAPSAHAVANIEGISVLGLAIIVLLLVALGTVVAGSLSRTS